MSAVLLAEVTDLCGEDAVAELLRRAGSTRSPEYLTDITNWISYDEAIALWRAGARVTQNPRLPTLAGQRAVRRLSASPVAHLLRSLGSPENLYREIATSATKFSTVVRLEAAELGPGSAEIVAVPLEGFPRSPRALRMDDGNAEQRDGVVRGGPGSRGARPLRGARRVRMPLPGHVVIGAASRFRGVGGAGAGACASSSTRCRSACTACSRPRRT